LKSARTLTLTASVVLAASLLSGCSAITNAVKAQTHAAACLEIAAQLKGVGAAITKEAPKLSTDPKGAAASISHDAKVFSAAADKLSNPTVKKKADAAAKQLTLFAADITALANDPSDANNTKLQGELTPLQDALDAIEKTCSAS
jgi:hypothetical protein